MSESINDIILRQLSKKKQRLADLRDQIDSTNYVEPQAPEKILKLLAEINQLEKLINPRK